MHWKLRVAARKTERLLESGLKNNGQMAALKWVRIRQITAGVARDGARAYGQARWLLRVMPKILSGSANPIEDSSYVLGFSQGVMWAQGWATIEQLRASNRQRLLTNRPKRPKKVR